MAALHRWFSTEHPKEVQLLVADAPVKRPDDNIPSYRSGFAWRLFSRCLLLLAEGTGTCGEYACSMTAEAHALVSAVAAILGLRHDCPLVIWTHSLSCLTYLARGPCDRSSSEVQRICHPLQELSKVRPQVILQFIYSHCEFSIHVGVDKLASLAAVQAVLSDRPPSLPPLLRFFRPKFTVPDVCNVVLEQWDFPWQLYPDSLTNTSSVAIFPTLRAPYKDTPPPPGWRDTSRLFVSPITSKSFPSDDNSWRSACAPTMDPLIRFLPRRIATHLYRLRVGVDPGIGGWQAISTGPPSPCPWWASPLTRETFTLYFLSCSQKKEFQELEVFPAEGIPPATLWGTDKELLAVLRYRRRCCSSLSSVCL